MAVVEQVAADVPNDSGWDAFRKCMLGQCEGMDGPPNVGCYRELAFEEAFAACDYACWVTVTYNRHGDDNGFHGRFGVWQMFGIGRQRLFGGELYTTRVVKNSVVKNA
jgi:hypothetical protein